MVATPTAIAQGGPAYATKLVVKTLGDEGSRPLVENVIRAKQQAAQNLEALEKADPKQLAKFLQEEHPQTIALILAHLHGNVSKALLMLLPDEIRTNAVKRLASMQNFSPEIVNKVTARLLGKFKSKKESDRRAYGGVKAVADLLNRIEPSASKAILESIEQQDPKLAVAIRNLMFTFEDLLTVADASIRELLANVEKKTLALALKGASEPLRDHIFKCMSSRATQMLKEDMEVLGPVRAREVTHAQQELIAVARNLEAAGKIVLKSESDDEYLV